MALKIPGIKSDVLLCNNRTLSADRTKRQHPIYHEKGRRRQSRLKIYRRVIYQGPVGKSDELLQPETLAFSEIRILHDYSSTCKTI